MCSISSKFLVGISLVGLLGCNTVASTRVVCGDSGPIIYDHDPGVRVIQSSVECTRLGPGSVYTFADGTTFTPGQGTVVFTTGQNDKGVSDGAISGIGLLGGALGLAASGGNPLGGVVGVALGEAANAVPTVLNKILGKDKEEEKVEAPTKPASTSKYYDWKMGSDGEWHEVMREE